MRTLRNGSSLKHLTLSQSCEREVKLRLSSLRDRTQSLVFASAHLGGAAKNVGGIIEERIND